METAATNMNSKTDTPATTQIATVYVRFKEGVLDPEGVTIQKSLAIMGYDKAKSVKTGKFFEIELSDDSAEARRQLQEMSEKALANPVIETFEILWPAKSSSSAQAKN